jgi:hypothetical protein
MGRVAGTLGRDRLHRRVSRTGSNRQSVHRCGVRGECPEPWEHTATCRTRASVGRLAENLFAWIPPDGAVFASWCCQGNSVDVVGGTWRVLRAHGM